MSEEYWRSIAEWQRDEIIKKCDSFKEEDDEIDRLTAELVEEKRARIAEVRCSARRLKRIAELEVQNDERLKIWNESITITAAQIDAAWESLDYYTRNERTPHNVAMGEGIATALSFLGIVRCEKCGGSGGHGSMEWGEGAMICATCNGHRWTRRALDGEEKYPCKDCGVLRTKAEGGTTFTVCDECWDKRRALDGEEVSDE